MIGTVLFVSNCTRGQVSEEPPIHLNPNMDDQEKYTPQNVGAFFADSASMRVPDAGTIAYGFLHDDEIYFTGKDKNGKFVKEAPVMVTKPLLKRGQQRFDIYCSPCHSRVGDGRGIMVNRGYVPPPSFHTDRIRELPDGHLFDVISNGIRNMPSYKHQVNVDDRWAIVAYLRAMQRSHQATIDDIPVELRDDVK
jgi:mono/diheme cytochrome c family protein